jgi:hypothetical protein
MIMGLANQFEGNDFDISNFVACGCIYGCSDAYGSPDLAIIMATMRQLLARVYIHMYIVNNQITCRCLVLMRSVIEISVQSGETCIPFWFHAARSRR